MVDPIFPPFYVDATGVTGVLHEQMLRSIVKLNDFDNVAVPNVKCAVYPGHYQTPPVFDGKRQVFEPSFQAQASGWQLVQAKNWFQRLVMLVVFGVRLRSWK